MDLIPAIPGHYVYIDDAWHPVIAWASTYDGEHLRPVTATHGIATHHAPLTFDITGIPPQPPGI